MSIDDAGNAGKPKPGNDRIDLSRFRRAPEATGNGGSKRVGKRVEARKPAKDVFFRVHPGEEYRMAAAVLELKDEKEVYLVDLALAADLPGFFSSAIVLTAITRKGDVFLWPLTIADANEVGQHEVGRQGLRAAGGYRCVGRSGVAVGFVR